MSWFHILLDAEEALKKEEKEGKEDPLSFRQKIKDTLFKEAIDFLFSFLGLFTYFYIITLAILYFWNLWGDYHTLAFMISALSEPYLGAVAVYTILKEYRKKNRKMGSLHKGEVFVGGWILMAVSAVLLTIFSDQYILNEPLEIIITNGIAVLFIYIGGVVHKP